MSIPATKTENFTSVKHFPNLGDQISVMPALKKYYELTKTPVKFLQMADALATYYHGAVHPTIDADGRMVCCNEQGIEMMKPLFESQEYIHSYEKYSGQQVNLDFDVIRGKTFCGMPNGAIQGWITYAFPDLAFDLSQPWITLHDEDCPQGIREQVKGKILLNFTERYRENIDYFFLKKYAPDLIFAGTEREYQLFCNQWHLTIPKLVIKDYLELAHAVKAVRFTLSNQSFIWNIAEALKSPRILEVCRFAINCQPMVGERSFGFFHQTAVEYYVRRLDSELR